MNLYLHHTRHIDRAMIIHWVARESRTVEWNSGMVEGAKHYLIAVITNYIMTRAEDRV